MMVIERDSILVDVYFKTEESGEQFVNYWNTLIGGNRGIVSVDYFKVTSKQAVEINPEIKYTARNYVEKEIVESYLELFPEEKE